MSASYGDLVDQPSVGLFVRPGQGSRDLAQGVVRNNRWLMAGLDFCLPGHKRPLICLATFEFLRKSDNTGPKFVPVGQTASLQHPQGWGRRGEGGLQVHARCAGFTGVGVSGVRRRFPLILPHITPQEIAPHFVSLHPALTPQKGEGLTHSRGLRMR